MIAHRDFKTLSDLTEFVNKEGVKIIQVLPGNRKYTLIFGKKTKKGLLEMQF